MMSDHRGQLHEELEQVRIALHQMASEAREPSPRTPSLVAPPTDCNVQVIVEIEARAATVERLFMISERQEWAFGQTLEYGLDALELALAKGRTGKSRARNRPLVRYQNRAPRFTPGFLPRS
jgi:hypothetical protein